MITQINTDTFISDTILFIRNKLREQITDPAEDKRTGESRFVATGYNKRNVIYPHIIIEKANLGTIDRMGLRSSLHYTRIPVDIRVFSESITELDKLVQQTMNALRSIQFETLGSVNARLYDFVIINTQNVHEDDRDLFSTIISVQYSFILGG